MRTYILGVGFDALPFDAALKAAAAFLDGDAPKTIYTPNPEIVMKAKADAAFRAVLNEGDLVIPDGIGIVYASRILGKPLAERVAGYDLMSALLHIMAKKGTRIYFLGAAPGVAEAAAARAGRKHPAINIVGVNDGYFDAERESIILKEIKALNTEALFVGLGAPRQELFIHSHKSELGCKLLMGVGGSFDGLSGRVKRAPDWYIKHNAEWLYRLMKQPGRAGRYAALPKFLAAAAAQKAAQKAAQIRNKNEE